ncbi:MAG TPA: hypothetical protein VKW08_11720 [Xanthobacteraceae bacterium]|nr:hypothetical protein [Xanthobacteraceae bacterium]
MFRKSLIAVAATALIATASMTPASAHPHGGHWGGFGLGIGLGILGAASIAAATAPAYVDSCWQYQYVQTPHGYLKRVLVNVCE